MNLFCLLSRTNWPLVFSNFNPIHGFQLYFISMSLTRVSSSPVSDRWGLYSALRVLATSPDLSDGRKRSDLTFSYRGLLQPDHEPATSGLVWGMMRRQCRASTSGEPRSICIFRGWESGDQDPMNWGRTSFREYTRSCYSDPPLLYDVLN